MTKKINLDEYQSKVVECNSNVIVIAGAGSGKSLTIVEKINHLINENICTPNEILAISFTNASVKDLKKKITYNINVFTFHQLAINILKSNNYSYTLSSPNLLEYTITEELKKCNKNDQKVILKYLRIPLTYNNFLKSKYFKSFCNFITSFINTYKSNNLSVDIILKARFSTLEKKIIKIIFEIYKTYMEEKKSTNSLDFDDLIIYSTKFANVTKFDYKYIIIDEFQDTSQIRLNLIYNIFKNSESKIIVVGDDYQSIYHFSGCDLNIFLNFTKLFPNVETIKLINTYRNSLELIKIAALFIQKNPIQIKKDLSSTINNSVPIVFAPHTDKIKSLKKILLYLEKISDDIMIVSRNNKDINKYIDNDFTLQDNILTFNNRSIKYYTIHKSKGLEAEYVIVINCNDSYLGFPNKIESNAIINKLLPNNEIRFAEERRLFYVAITRCKKQAFLLYDKNLPSIFIKEIKKITKKIVHNNTIFK